MEQILRTVDNDSIQVYCSDASNGPSKQDRQLHLMAYNAKSADVASAALKRNDNSTLDLSAQAMIVVAFMGAIRSGQELGKGVMASNGAPLIRWIPVRHRGETFNRRTGVP